MTKKTISIEVGSGGEQTRKFLESFMPKFFQNSKWQNQNNDSATYLLPSGDTLCFTTDSYIVNPIKFNGGNIGDLAINGTINDLAVMGAEPIGISLALIVEEGFSEESFQEIIQTINEISKKTKIPIVTGDTKVMEKGSIDKIAINTSGVGVAKKVLSKKIETNDSIIISGPIANHAIALLSKRFDFSTNIKTDSKPLLQEMREIKEFVKAAKDPTRGGIASTLNEIAQENKVKIELIQKDIPVEKEVRAACDMLGLDYLTLANEGRLLTICKKENEEKVLELLKKFNPKASIIGRVKNVGLDGEVVMRTELGSILVPMPSGKIVPRIC